MNRPQFVFCSILLTLLLLGTVRPAMSAETTERPDSALYNYYASCTRHLSSPDVLLMCDTLSSRAAKAGNNHFRVLAYLTKLDYYYFRNDKNKVPEYAAEAKRMCRKYGETNYYYFVWGSRLVTFYLKNGMSNYALLEAQNMLHEAQAEESQIGMIECCKALGQIYAKLSNHKMAADYFRKLIDLVLKYDPEDPNIPIYYSSLAESELHTEHYVEAGEALDKIEEYLAKSKNATPYQSLSVERGRLQLSTRTKNKAGARRAFERIEKIFAEHTELAIHQIALLEAQLDYYAFNREYGKALAIIDSIQRSNHNSEVRTLLLSQKGEICWLTNDRAAAAECFRSYISLSDSVRQASSENSANEIAGLLNLQQLEKEKQQLEVDIQHRRLRTTYWTIALLTLALAMGTILVIRLTRLNRHLKEAKRIVTSQNQELEAAKLRAEEASSMKSRFIQDISHEVRTPLNAIVGFSGVVGELCEEPEAREYASIIAANSDNLLRLFNDVLELSSLDELKKLSYNTPDDLNASCRKALEALRPQLKAGVELSYRTSDSELQVLTNPAYVLRVLDCVLHNAAKFTESGHISLDCTVDREERTIRYSISDTGRGIPADQTEKIFERFQKVDSFTQGSGLGLSVSRSIAEKLDGTLTVDPSYTGGARFILTLPLCFPGE